MATRRLDNWLTGYMDYTADQPSPALFRQWSGIFLLATALERKVWCNVIPRKPLFPNLQVMFVAPPGIGKSLMTAVVEDLHKELPEHKRAPNDISKASFIDALNSAKRCVADPLAEETEFNSMMVLSNELGALLPNYDGQFLSLITELYDCRPFAESRRHRNKEDQIDIQRPQINLLFVTSPSQLKDLMPEGAWDQGFAARTMLIFDDKSVMTDLFTEATYDKALETNIITDLQTIGEYTGRMMFDKPAAEFLMEWHRGGGQPRPQHPKLQNYLTRRTSMHLPKLSMIASVAESEDLLITEAHVKTAQGWLLEAEKRMPFMFRNMVAGGDREILKEVWFAARREANQNGQLISHSRIYTLIQDRTSESWKIPGLLTSLVRQGVLTPKGGSKDNPDYSVAKFKGAA